MSDDPKSALAHFQQTLAVAEKLASKGLAVYYHEWHFDAFGSWTMVVGGRHQRFRFIWDGKDSLMSVSECEKSSGGHAEKWSAITEKHLSSAAQEPLAYIHSFFLSRKTI